MLSREDLFYNSNNNAHHSNYNTKHDPQISREAQSKSASQTHGQSSSGIQQQSQSHQEAKRNAPSGSMSGGMSLSGGTDDVNEDIQAFMMAKDQLLKRREDAKYRK